MSRPALMVLLGFLGAITAARAEGAPGALETAAAPEAGASAGKGAWKTMVHGWAFLTSDRQGGRSGDQISNRRIT